MLEQSVRKHFHHPWSYSRVQDSWRHRTWCYYLLPLKQLLSCQYAEDFAFLFHELSLTAGFTKSKHILKNWPFSMDREGLSFSSDPVPSTGGQSLHQKKQITHHLAYYCYLIQISRISLFKPH